MHKCRVHDGGANVHVLFNVFSGGRNFSSAMVLARREKKMEGKHGSAR